MGCGSAVYTISKWFKQNKSINQQSLKHMWCNYLCDQYRGRSKTEKSSGANTLIFNKVQSKKLDFWCNFTYFNQKLDEK